jgi:hypothetical protein
MGHADVTATQVYLHYKPRRDAARRLGVAFGGAAGAAAGKLGASRAA